MEPVQAMCPAGVEFIASHPMAGRETSSVEHAAEVNFAPANFIITPTEKNTPEAIQWAKELAEVLGAEVGASRAAVDAGFTEPERQVGQTGVTVRPKLYIACGISGQIQHTAGMDQSSMVISINTDPEAPINKIADYAIVGDVNEIIPKMIKYYKQNSK